MQLVLMVVIAVFTVLMTVIGALVGVIFKDLRGTMDQLRAQIAVNGRHLDSMMATSWQLTWRINGLEDHLAATGHYHPPRIIGQAETGLT